MTKLTAILVTLLLGIIAPVSLRADQAAITVTVKTDAYVSGACITLADISAITGDAGLSDKAGKLMMRRVPTGLAAEQITRDRILDRLNTNGIASKQVTFAGAAKCNAYNAVAYGKAAPEPVEAAKPEPARQPEAPKADASKADVVKPAADTAAPVAQPVPSNGSNSADTVIAPRRSIVEIARQKICEDAAKLQGCAVEDIVLEDVRPNDQLKNLPGGVQRFINCFDTGKVGGALGGRAFKILVEVDGKDMGGDLRLTVTVAQMRTLAVAARRLAQGAVLTAADVELKRVPCKASIGQNFTAASDVDGMELTGRAMDAGELFQKSLLRPAVIVKRNAVLVLSLNGIAVNGLTGKALEDGAKGDVIRVEREANKDIKDAKPAKVVLRVRITSATTGVVVSTENGA
jgi:flagella basal body P-ring formation protein FlgA